MAENEGQNQNQNDDETGLETRFNQNLTLRSHREIGPYMTKNFRIKYAGLHNLLLRKPSVKKNLHFIHVMSAPAGAPEQFVQSEADNVRSANDILNFNVAKSSGALIAQNDKENLVKTLRACLENDGLGADFIEAILNQFDGNLSCEEYVSVFVNLHVLKACGFAHDRMFFACLQDLRASGDKEKLIELTARFYVSVLKANDNFNSDSARNEFLKIVTKYATRAPLHKPDEKLVSQIGPSGLSTLNSIRQNALFNIQSFLASEKKREKLYTPLEVYAARDSYPTLRFTNKQLERLAKSINQSNKEPIDLMKSFQSFPISFCCFLCPSSDPSPHPSRSQSPTEEFEEGGEGPSSSDRPTFRPPISFVDRVVGKFNVLRLEPRNSRAAVDAHYNNVHTSLTSGQVNDLHGHHYIFVCPECLHDNISDAVICCPNHYEDHNKILHPSTLTHLRILTKLREVFKDDSSALRIVDKYLLTVCSFCRLLFPDKESRDIHIDKVCVPRHVSLSTYYGESITTTPTFKTYSTLEAEKQERVTHLVSCLKSVAKHILRGPQTVSADVGSPSATTVGSTSGNANANKKLDLFSTLVLNETQMHINTFDSPRSLSRSPSPRPSHISVATTESANLSGKASSSASTIPAVQRRQSEEPIANESNSKQLRKEKKGQKTTKPEKRREFQLLSKEALQQHQRDNSRGHVKDDNDDNDESDDESDDDSNDDSNNDLDVEANENGIIEDEMDDPVDDDRDCNMDVIEEAEVVETETTEDARRRRDRNETKGNRATMDRRPRNPDRETGRPRDRETVRPRDREPERPRARKTNGD